MRAELDVINARISGGHSNMERRVCGDTAPPDAPAAALALTARAARRAALFGGQQQGEGGAGGGWGGGSGNGSARGGSAYGDGETEQTVNLDNGQLVQQQRTVMKRACSLPRHAVLLSLLFASLPWG